MPFYDRMMLRKRYIIETINDMLKNTAQIVHSWIAWPFGIERFGRDVICGFRFILEAGIYYCRLLAVIL